MLSFRTLGTSEMKHFYKRDLWGSPPKKHQRGWGGATVVSGMLIIPTVWSVLVVTSC